MSKCSLFHISKEIKRILKLYLNFLHKVFTGPLNSQNKGLSMFAISGEGLSMASKLLVAKLKTFFAN